MEIHKPNKPFGVLIQPLRDPTPYLRLIGDAIIVGNELWFKPTRRFWSNLIDTRHFKYAKFVRDGRRKFLIDCNKDEGELIRLINGDI